MSSVSIFLTVIASLTAIPVAIFFVEIIAAVFLTTRRTSNSSEAHVRRRVAVLVPAHNERTGIGLTIDDVKAQLQFSDRLLVVADNCADDTAIIATAAGAEVIVRNEPTKIGKGYALDFGLKHLSQDPPSVVIVVDADCRLSEGAIDELALKCTTSLRPVQALYLMSMPHGSSINHRVAEFAWRVKNWLRPLGLESLNLPCQLMGSGMAFPWGLLHSVDIANGSIVEDLKLGLDMARLGSAPLFCHSAKVTSHFPLSIEGAQSQRKRWEEGHIAMISSMAPRLIYKAITDRNLGLLALAFDLTVPPLSLLVIVVTGMFFIGVIAVLLGLSPIALLISTASLATLAASVLLSWVKCGRDIIPSNAVFLIASYLLAKLPLYRRLLSDRSAPQWIKTDRSDTRATPNTTETRPVPPIAPQAIDP